MGKGGPPLSSAGRKLKEPHWGWGWGERQTGTRDGKEGAAANTTPGEVLGSQKAEAYPIVLPPQPRAGGSKHHHHPLPEKKRM